MKMEVQNGSHRYDINRPGFDIGKNIANTKSVSV